MKFVTILAMLCAAFVLSAAETALWDGSKNIFKISTLMLDFRPEKCYDSIRFFLHYNL